MRQGGRLFAVGVVLLAVLMARSQAAQAETGPARIEAAAPCFVQPLDDMSAVIGAFDCGYVVVPETHAAPEGREVRLGFVRLPARGQARGAPIFMLSGGPGSTLLKPETFSLFGDDFLGPLREGRDIVILEERGSFHSIPSLVCPGLGRLPWLANQFGFDRTQGFELYSAMVASCAEQAVANGIDLSQYNSLSIAADIDLARRAMGYDRIVFYGASYGAQLGQHVLRDYPGMLEAVILDGANALSVRSWVQDRVINVEEGVEHLTATCEADPKCGEAFDIRALLDRAFALFDEGPIPASYQSPGEADDVIDLTLREEDLAAAIFEMQTGQVFIRTLPVMLHMAVADGRTSMAAVLGQLAGEKVLAARDAAGGGLATLMHVAVVCSDDPVRSAQDMIVPETASRYARVFGRMVLEEYLMYCAAVDVPELPASTDVDPVSDVPALVLSGWLDVRTPTARSLEVAKALADATLVTFWEGTHVQLGEVNLCAAQIVGAFVNNPTAEIDASCVDEIPRRGFVLPDYSISTEGSD